LLTSAITDPEAVSVILADCPTRIVLIVSKALGSKRKYSLEQKDKESLSSPSGKASTSLVLNVK
jgi:hypothetical protein